MLVSAVAVLVLVVLVLVVPVMCIGSAVGSHEVSHSFLNIFELGLINEIHGIGVGSRRFNPDVILVVLALVGDED